MIDAPMGGGAVTRGQHRINIIPKNSIRAIHSVEQDGVTHVLGELRDLRWNDVIAAFLPAKKLSISWVRLSAGETLAAHMHPIQSMMVFHQGSGQLIGDLERPLTAGDIVVVPAGARHGFMGGPEGLSALSIQFDEGLYTNPSQPRVRFEDDSARLHAELLRHNQTRIEEFSKLPLFSMLNAGTLDDPRKRKRYLEALQIWVNGNQALLLSRQATSVDPAFAPLFWQHMQEEIGHDLLHRERDGHEVGEAKEPAVEPFSDAIMDSITDWFVHQMYVRDNIEKAALIHLVIENASIVYHRCARPALAKYTNDKYFQVHVEADAQHAKMGEDLVRGATPRTYARLRQLLDEAWDMMGAMTDRLVTLTAEI